MQTARNVVLTLLLVAAAHAGPIFPPAGPVTSTYKTLTEVEPRIAINATNTPGDANSVFRITQSGSYYFAGNITGVAAKHGIEIAAPNVTIDLNGFSLIGVTGTLNAFTASDTGGDFITVRNGVVRNWGNGGVHLIDNLGTASIVERVRAHNNGWDGIAVGNNSIVTDCIVQDNGFMGIRADEGCTIARCVAHSNTQSGFVAGTGSRVSDSTASANSSAGFIVNSACVIAHCAADANLGVGINAGSGSIVSHCASHDNTGSGIAASTGVRVESCTVRSNEQSGISVTSGCIIANNTCSVNGQGSQPGAGIFASGSDNRIEGNNCTNQDFGIDVNGSGNIIVRNSCASNTTNWDIAANNFYGPIINRVGVATVAVSGDAAVSTLGSTDANANYTY
jgi:parallel beta-helix repeat protein